jgi:hypothetical protein
VRNRSLTLREKSFLVAGTISLLGFLAWYLIASPVLEQRRQLRQAVRVNKARLAELQILQAQYRTLEQGNLKAKQRLQLRPADFSLFAYLDKLAGTTGLKNHVAYMKPTAPRQTNDTQIDGVEMKLEAVTLDQLRIYLYQVETSPDLIDIRRLAINAIDPDQGLIDGVMLVETVNMASE